MILWLLGGLLAAFVVHQFWYRRRHLPNGPTPLPFIGNVLSFAKKDRWEDVFLKWRERYGPVMTIWMGMKPMVLINDYATAHRMFVKEGETFVDRGMDAHFAKIARGGLFGIIIASGERWRQQRRFALHTLRDFGLNKSQLEARVLDEVQYVIDHLNEDVRAGVEEVDVYNYTDIAVGSVVNSIICGYRFTADNKQEEFYKLKKLTTDILANFSNPLFRVILPSPFLHRFSWVQRKMHEAVKPQKEVFRFLDGIIQQHEEQNDYSSDMEPSDFIDAFMLERNKAEKSGEQHYFTHEQLRNVVFDMWFAGQETTSSTLTWGIAYLIRNPDAQRKLHEELDRVIGGDRLIAMNDKANLPYTNATINEIQRCANILAVNLPRRCARDYEIDGQMIPKGTIVVPQLSVILIDPQVFPEPQSFNPDRFIDEKGQLKHVEELVPFSMGKRICLGEGLARMEASCRLPAFIPRFFQLFLFFANIFNHFEFSAANEPPTLRKAFGGASTMTAPYKCRVTKRF